MDVEDEESAFKPAVVPTSRLFQPRARTKLTGKLAVRKASLRASAKEAANAEKPSSSAALLKKGSSPNNIALKTTTTVKAKTEILRKAPPAHASASDGKGNPLNP